MLTRAQYLDPFGFLIRASSNSSVIVAVIKSRMQTRAIYWRSAQQRGSRADLLFILMWSLLLMSFVPLLQALVQELNFCAYLGLPAFMIPLRGPHCANLARILLNHIHTGHHSCMVMAICSIEWKQICSEHTIICLCIHPGPIIYTQSLFLLLPCLFVFSLMEF